MTSLAYDLQLFLNSFLKLDFTKIAAINTLSKFSFFSGRKWQVPEKKSVTPNYCWIGKKKEQSKKQECSFVCLLPQKCAQNGQRPTRTRILTLGPYLTIDYPYALHACNAIRKRTFHKIQIPNPRQNIRIMVLPHRPEMKRKSNSFR